MNYETSTQLLDHDVPQRNIHKYNWTSPDGYTDNHIVNKLIHRRAHSITLDVQSVRELTVVPDVERFNLRKLSDMEVRKKISV